MRPPRPIWKLYLTAMARMGVATGYAGTRFNLLPASQAAQAKDSDLLIISHGQDRLLTGWQRDLPALIEQGKRSLRPLDRSLDQRATCSAWNPNTCPMKAKAAPC
jgi:hypothetical protein